MIFTGSCGSNTQVNARKWGFPKSSFEKHNLSSRKLKKHDEEKVTHDLAKGFYPNAWPSLYGEISCICVTDQEFEKEYKEL